MTTIASSCSSSGASAQLVKMASGEYTAASVASDQTDANKLGLIKEKDGNYGTSQPPVTPSATAAAQSSPAAQSVLTTLTLGG
jgi:hypothetical protein